MREKTIRLFVTFHTTAGAVAMEKYCREAELPGRLAPVPRRISSDCGMAWCAPPDARAALEALATRYRLDVDGYYEL